VIDISAVGVVVNANILTDDGANTTNIGVQNGASDVVVTNNVIKGTGGASSGIGISASTNVIEANNLIEGFQSNSVVTIFTDLDATPDVSNGKFYTCSNSVGTTITMFDGGRPGQDILVYFTTANTTIDFTGTNLVGNGGADWTPTTADYLTAWFDGTYWHCNVVDCSA